MKHAYEIAGLVMAIASLILLVRFGSSRPSHSTAARRPGEAEAWSAAGLLVESLRPLRWSRRRRVTRRPASR